MNLNTMSAAACIVAVTGLLATPALADQSQDLTDFRNCVYSATGPQWNSSTQTCTLPYYSTPYMISSSISINSSSVRYISSGSGGTAQTWPQATLMRDVSSVGSSGDAFDIMNANSNASNLLIESLIFDGNRGGTTSGGTTYLLCITPSQYTGPWIDLNLSLAGYSAPTANSGVNVEDVTFNNSPNWGLDLGPYSYVYWSWFYYARQAAVFAQSNDIIDDNVMDYNGTGAIDVAGNNILVEYNSLYHNHDEWMFTQPGGQIFVDAGYSGFTIISNDIDGGSAYCNSSCSQVVTTAGNQYCYPPGGHMLYTLGIEMYSPTGILTNNELKYHSGAGLYTGFIDGTGLTGGAITLSEYDPNLPTTDYYIENNSGDGVQLNNIQATGGAAQWGGAFSFTDLRSRNNGCSGCNAYGFRWKATSGQVASGTTLSWGTGNSACLTGNTTGATSLPSGFSGPGSTNTCP